MGIQKEIEVALSVALKAGEKLRVSTLRLIRAAIKDREIALRGKGNSEQKGCGNEEVLAILDKMVRQREESAKEYRRGEREELAHQEEEEIKIIRGFMPAQLDEEASREACRAIISEMKAESIRDMGRVINCLKQRYPGQIDIARASYLVRELLTHAA